MSSILELASPRLVGVESFSHGFLGTVREPTGLIDYEQMGKQKNRESPQLQRDVRWDRTNRVSSNGIGDLTNAGYFLALLKQLDHLGKRHGIIGLIGAVC